MRDELRPHYVRRRPGVLVLVERRTLLNMGGVEAGFSIESWWLPLDHEMESLTRLALVFHQERGDAVVLVSPEYARKLAVILMGFAAEHPT